MESRGSLPGLGRGLIRTLMVFRSGIYSRPSSAERVESILNRLSHEFTGELRFGHSSWWRLPRYMRGVQQAVATLRQLVTGGSLLTGFD